MQKHVAQQQKTSQNRTFCILSGRRILSVDFNFCFGLFYICLSSEIFEPGLIISILKFYFIAACKIDCTMNCTCAKN